MNNELNNTQKLLLRVMDRVPRNSKDGLAKAIGANRSNVREYLKGTRYPNAAHAIKIGEILGMTTEEVVLYIQEDKTRNPEQRELLRRKLPRLHSAAAIALALLAGFTFGGSWDAQASALTSQKIMPDLYIIRSDA